MSFPVSFETEALLLQVCFFLTSSFFISVLFFFSCKYKSEEILEGSFIALKFRLTIRAQKGHDFSQKRSPESKDEMDFDPKTQLLAENESSACNG